MNNENLSFEGKTKNITFGHVISWIIGVIFILAGIALVFKNPVTGILFLVAAFVSIPTGNTVIKNKLKISLSKGSRIFLVIVLVIIGSSMFPKSDSQIAGTSSINSDSNSQSKQPVPSIKVTAIQLSEDYKSNEVAADAQYKGKLVEVSGTVNTIGKDILDTPYVSLQTDQYSIVGVQCMFDKNSEQQLINLSKGQSISLQGEVSGKLMNVIIRGCSITK